jgi:ADP-heptose:LPS heptosyltransferase
VIVNLGKMENRRGHSDKGMTQKTLLRFRHGLGDAVQLTIVLKHLAKFRPNWIVDVESGVGKHSVFHGLCNESWIAGRKEADPKAYDKIFQVHWFESFGNIPYTSVPPTKTTKALRDEFRIDPDTNLFYYQINITDESRRLATQYLSKIPQRKGYILAHFQGNTSFRAKNVEEPVMRKFCSWANQQDYTVIVLDWDRRKASQLANGSTIFCPGVNDPIWGGNNTGDGNVLAALIEQANLFVGIDSGPLHVAGATMTPTLGLWTGHHPMHYYELSNNVKHLLPIDSKNNIHSKFKFENEEYFHDNYQYRYYADLTEVLIEEAAIILNSANPKILPKLEDFPAPPEPQIPKFVGSGRWWRIGARIETLDIVD